MCKCMNFTLGFKEFLSDGIWGNFCFFFVFSENFKYNLKDNKIKASF